MQMSWYGEKNKKLWLRKTSVVISEAQRKRKERPKTWTRTTQGIDSRRSVERSERSDFRKENAVFPIIGPLATVLAALGGYALLWYHSLTKSEQEEADRLAMEYAKRLYSKGLDELTAAQARRVHEAVKGHFTK